MLPKQFVDALKDWNPTMITRLAGEVDPDAVHVGIPLVQHCARVGAGDAMRTLLKRGADPRAESVSGDTLVHAASRGGLARDIEDAVVASGYVRARNHRGELPEDIAASKPATLRGILSGVKKSAFQYAATGNVEGLDAILSCYGAELKHARGGAGQSLAHAAIRSGNPEVVDCLFRNGQPLDEPGFGLVTPQLLAASQGDTAMVARLHSCGVTLSKYTNEMLATRGKSLERGAEVAKR